MRKRDRVAAALSFRSSQQQQPAAATTAVTVVEPVVSRKLLRVEAACGGIVRFVSSPISMKPTIVPAATVAPAASYTIPLRRR